MQSLTWNKFQISSHYFFRKQNASFPWLSSV
uniref:Uncharacterized protein n=1 Tax=Arundo donax TaxID=35708 RepID=A0A0A9AZ00_ARUDO